MRVCVCVCRCAGLVSEQKNQVEEKARSGDGHGQEEAGLGDREAEGQLGQRGRGRRLQQTSGSELGRRENHTAAEETQTGLGAAAAHFGERQLLIHGDIFTFCGGIETDSRSGTLLAFTLTLKDLFLFVYIYFFLHVDGNANGSGQGEETNKYFVIPF